MKGKYYAELYDGKRRRSLCLRTDNLEIALQRYGAGLKELAKRIRLEHEASKPQAPLLWLPEEPFEVWHVPDGMEMTIENLERHGFPVEERAESVVRDDQLRQLSWDDLVDNARKQRRRKTGKDYSPAWIKNTTTVLDSVDFLPAELTPQRIHR